ncbi:MAG: ABC transporter ATP-binding protein [Firmicutes bacterium]|nr:ABC transporter ATP-binding protein [Bacillota bacterium]
MRYILSYYRNYIPFMFLIMAFLFGQAMCELALPGYMSDIINNGIVKGDLAYVKGMGSIMIAVSAAAMICAIGGVFFASWSAARIARNIRSALFRKVMAFSAAEMDRFQTASLITRSTNDIQMVQQTTIMFLRMAMFAPIMGIGAVYKALHTSVSLSWTVGVALGVIICIMGIAFFAVLPKFKVLQSKLDRLNLIMKERLAGILVIRAFTTERQEEHRFDEANLDLTGINIFINRAMSFLMPSLMFVMNAISVLIVWAGAHLIEADKLLIGDMLAYLQYAMHVIMSFLFVTAMFILLPRAIVSAQRISEVLGTELSIRDPDQPLQLPETEESSEQAGPANARGLVEFRHAGFAYPDAENNALTDIDFNAEPGQVTAIIGGTGSGKSTLIQLIPRFYDVTEGQVLVDGVDVRSVSQHDLREKIGLVPQKGTLFSGTIASNLRYGDEKADEADLVRAAEIAQAMEFIEKKEAGFEEPVAQGGTNVSGGQKQRLSIARALVKKPEIYIFDDSFSALDFTTDKALRAALKKAAGGSTIIIVAQRINTILDADQIIVLDEGRIVGKGNHRELMASCRVYQEIARSQLSDEELARYGAGQSAGASESFGERGRSDGRS